MVFVHPEILYGLFLAAIPILIHLLNFRKTKTIYFSSLKFLDEIESSHRNRRNLQDLLLMILRVISIILIVLAFAQPTISRNKTNQFRTGITGIYIDNSESMGIQSGNETLLASAKSAAIKLIRSLPPDMRYYLLSNGNDQEFNGQADPELAIDRISNLQVASNNDPLGKVLAQFIQVNDSTQSVITEAYLFSDFCRVNIESPLPGGSAPIELIPVALRNDEVTNLGIDTCWFESPEHRIGETDILSLVVGNYSEQEFNDVLVSLQINDTLKGQQVVSLPSNGKIRVDLPFTVRTEGWQRGRLWIADYPYEPDNEMFFSYSIESGIPVLHLFGSIPNTFVHSLYGYDSTYRYEEYQLKAYPRADYDGFGLVVLSDIKELDADLSSKLVQFINNGGTVWFFPDMDGQLVNYNQFLARLSLPEITSVNNYPIQTRMGESLSKWMEKVIINPAKNPRLPAVNQSFRMTGSRADYSPLLSGMAGEMILSQFSIGKGRFILSTFPLKEEATDLMFHPLFVPLCYKLASAGIKDAPLYQVIGKENALEVPTSLISGTGNIRLVNTGTNEQYSPVFRAGAGGSSFIFADGIESTGYFNLFQGENLKGTFAFNSSRRESDLRILADSLVIEKLTNAGWRTSKNLLSHQDLNKNTKNELPINKQLWHYLLIISIIILLFESWLMHNKK